MLWHLCSIGVINETDWLKTTDFDFFSSKKLFCVTSKNWEFVRENLQSKLCRTQIFRATLVNTRKTPSQSQVFARSCTYALQYKHWTLASLWMQYKPWLVDTSTATSLGYQGWRKIFWEGRKLCPIVFSYAQHIFPRRAKKFAGGESPPAYGPDRCFISAMAKQTLINGQSLVLKAKHIFRK